VIQKDGLNFVVLYFKIRTSDKYDINYIWLYSTHARQLVARCTAVVVSVSMNSRKQKNLMLLSSHFALNWRCSMAVR